MLAAGWKRRQGFEAEPAMLEARPRGVKGEAEDVMPHFTDRACSASARRPQNDRVGDKHQRSEPIGVRKCPSFALRCSRGGHATRNASWSRELTSGFVRARGCKPEGLHVVITEVYKEDWGSGGALCADKFPDK